jgi:DNA polymerase III alpha subunit
MDIDIDFKSTFDLRQIIPSAVRASMVNNNELVKHPCGNYLQTMPVDQHTGLAAIPYKQAEKEGFFKIDCLHLSVLDPFSSKTEIRQLLKQEPDWTLLLDQAVVGRLFQLKNSFELLKRIKPKSVEEIADCIALIRPGKRFLIDSYMRDRESIRQTLYRSDNDGYTFKRSHAIGYALTIVLQLHLISQGRA